MRNLKLTVAYDGTCYHGFQDQGVDSLPTIQRTLEKAWERLVDERVRLNGAGRTDAGVHAEGQVVNLRTGVDSIPDARIPHAFNSLLPRDIAVVGCERVADSFHARYDCHSKVYAYTILNRAFPSPLERLYTHFVHDDLDAQAMEAAAKFLVGRHDFKAFAGSNSKVRSTVRTLYSCAVEQVGIRVIITVEADGFLYNMVRAIAGTLLSVGKGEHAPDWVGCVLESRKRTNAGPTLPAKGLVLRRVRYEPPILLDTRSGPY